MPTWRHGGTITLPPDDVQNIKFSRPGFRKRGYSMVEVDAFLDLVEITFRSGGPLTAQEVRNATFSPRSRRGAYTKAEVAEFLTVVAATLEQQTRS